MIRKCGFILASVILFFRIAAQDLPGTNKNKYEGDYLKRTFIGIQAGAAIPFSEFASKDFNNTVSGYANTGYNVNAVLRYSFTDYFAIGIMYFYSNNPFDSKTLLKDLYSNIPAYDHTFTSDPWVISGFLFVPTYIFRTSKYNIEVGIGVGNVFSTMPSYYVTQSNSSGTFTSSFSATDTNNWGFSFDAAIRYKIYKDFILSLQSEVFVSDQTYRNLSLFVTLPSGQSGYLDIPNYLQPFRLIHLTAGIGFQID